MTLKYSSVSSSSFLFFFLFFLLSDLCGYVKSLLGVEDAIFNIVPIARSLDMPGMEIDEVTKCWEDDGEQLDMILQYWLRENNVAENLDEFRRHLEQLKKGLFVCLFNTVQD